MDWMTLPPKQQTVFEVPSSLEEIPGATQRLFDFLDSLRLSDSDRFDIRLCFEEILINGMKHGNQFKRDIPVRVEAAYNDREVYISVIDEGKGFDPEKIKDPTVDENIERNGGRGVYLVRHLMNQVRYGARGSSAEIFKIIHAV